MYEHLEIRCPKLGHQVKFAYCEKEGGGIPCSRAIACWQSFFPVREYFKKTLTEEQWKQSFDHVPKGKIPTLIELIEAAKERKKMADMEK